MKVAIFSTKYYEREYLDQHNADGNHQLTYFETPLNADTAGKAKGLKLSTSN